MKVNIKLQLARILLLLILIATSSISIAKEAIIIDTDTGAFHPLTLDVDDDLAVLFALAENELDIKGVTTTYGNGFQWQTFPDAKRLLRLSGRDIPVFRGADYFSKKLSRSTKASRFIIETAMTQKDGITIIALGAMTNIAAAITQEPEIINKINRIVIMGGYLAGAPLEINFAVDEKSTNILLNAPIPKVVLPVETCIQSAFTAEYIDQIANNPDTVVYRFVKRLRFHNMLMQFLFTFSYPKSKYPQKAKGGFIPWDLVPMAFLTHPEYFSDTK